MVNKDLSKCNSLVDKLDCLLSMVSDMGLSDESLNHYAVGYREAILKVKELIIGV